MSEKDFVLAWLLVTRANGKVSWADSLDTARVIAKQARAIYKQLMEEEDEINS
jgi:uncharacterized alpha/beta hydrolase family protein